MLLLRKYFILVFLVLGSGAFGQGIFSHIPYIKNFTTSDYRAEAQNRAILQDQHGVLYFGNGKGLLRFDGKNWDLIPLANKSAARSMAMDSSGTIYVGGQGDFGLIEVGDNGISQFKSIAQRMPAAFRNFEGVSNVFCRGNDVVFHTLTGTFIYKNGAITFVRPSILFQYAFQIKGEIYVNETGKGLLQLKGNNYKPVKGGEVFANERIDLMVPFKGDQILIFVRNKGIYLFSTGKNPSLKKTDMFSSVENYIGNDPVDDGKVLDDSLFAIATKDKGLVLFDETGKILSVISRANGIINEQILSVYFDNNHNIWLGLEDGISFVSLQSPYTNYSEDSGLKGIVLCAVQYNDKIYIGTTQGIFSQQYANGRIFGSFEFLEGSSGECWNFAIVNGKLLTAHTNGLFEINGNKLRQLYKEHTWAIEPYSDNLMIIGTYSKGLHLVEFNQGAWQYKNKILGYDLSARYIQSDSSGLLWVSHPYKGIYRLKVSSTLKSIEKTDFFSSEQGLPANTSNYVYESPKGLIFGTENGFYQFESSSSAFVPFQQLNDSLGKEKPIKKITYDINGNLWYGTGESVGFYEFNPTNPTETVNHEQVQKLKSTLVYSLTPLTDGNMLFGVSNGFLFLNRKAYEAYSEDRHKNFNTIISNVENVENDSVIAGCNSIYSQTNTSDVLVLPHFLNSMRFNFSSSFFEDHDKCQFKYYLEGYENDYCAWTTKSSKEYTNLSPGAYTFKVQCLNVYNNIGKEALFRFEIKSPWYRTNLAYFGYFFTVLLTFVIGVQWYNQRLHKKNKILAHKIEIATSALRQNNEEIAQKNAELVELNEDKNHLISIVAHDLRSPLNQMKGFVNIVKITGHNLTEEQKDYLGIISTTLDRLNLMIHNILDVNAAMHKTVVLDYQELDLVGLVKEVAESYKKPAHKKHIKILVSSDFPEIRSTLDPTYGLQVIDNLVSNAVKYTWRGKDINIRITKNQGINRIAIFDNGPGLNEQDFKKIFGKYQKLTAKPTGGEASTGLGLSIVKKYVEAMNGKVWAENQEGEGAVFIVEFPAAR